MDDGYDDQSMAKLGGFQTKDSLDSALVVSEATASVDVTNIRSVGHKLHVSANAMVHGDNHGVDEFKEVPVPYFGHNETWR